MALLSYNKFIDYIINLRNITGLNISFQLRSNGELVGKCLQGAVILNYTITKREEPIKCFLQNCPSKYLQVRKNNAHLVTELKRCLKDAKVQDLWDNL